MERERVCQEIGDHLRDSVAASVQGGADQSTAAAEVIGRLGLPADMARRIERAQQTPARLKRARRGAVVILVTEMLVWALACAVVVVIAPGIGNAITGLAGLAGLHLAVLQPGEWFSSQVALTLCIGAFTTGRISIGYLARTSRHRDATVRRGWALSGAAILLVPAVIIPFYQDPLTMAAMLAIPLAFVAGTLRGRQYRENTFTVRGVASALALMLAIVYMPGVRLFAFDPSGTPGLHGAATGSGEVGWQQQPNGTFTYSVSPPQEGLVWIELWPAARHGFTIGPDAVAASVGMADGETTSVDLGSLKASGQWWVVAVETKPDGTRTAIDVRIQTGTTSGWGNLLGWVIGRF